MKGLIAFGLAAALAAPALAGTQQPAPAEPTVQQPTVAPAPTMRNFTGGYVGGQIGYADANVNNAPLSGSDPFIGVHAGYTQDIGGFILGGEIEWDYMDLGLGAGNTLDDVARLKLRGGVAVGPDTMVYGLGGAARASTSGGAGSDNGWLVGAGVEHMVTDQFSVGSELMYHRFSNFGNIGNRVEATTISLRGSFRF